MILRGSVFQDLRYGIRILRRNLGITSLAVFALAVGIGANTAVFTAYKAMVARPLDARAPARMVNLALVRQSGVVDYKFSYPDYEAYRDSMHSLSGLIAFSPEQMMLSTGTAHPEFVGVFVVSENYFQVLGVKLLRGRAFASIGVPALISSPSVLISENYWQTRFGGDPAVLGKTIRLNGAAVQIAGITPRNFVGTSIGAPDFWLPLCLEPLVHGDPNWLRNRENRRFRLFGRLASDVTAGQAQAEMTTVANRIRALHEPHSESAQPSTALVWPGSPFPLPLRHYPGMQLTILLVMIAAGMLLVVACANVGSLQLARARARQHELRTRLSLGASRLRLIRQLLTESVLLGLIAGVAGLLLAWAFLQILVVLVADALPVQGGTVVFHVAPDLETFAYVLAISLVAGVLFGLAPAIDSSRSALVSTVRGGTSSRGTRRLQNLLIAAQVSLSLVLMITGSVFIRSAIHELETDPGYETKHVIALDIQFPEALKYTAAHKLALIRKVRTRLAATPGVAAVTSARPPANDTFRTAAVALGQSRASLVYYNHVQPNYFETLSIPVSLGHGFQAHGQSESSVIVSESAAEQLWSGKNPIGRSIRLGPTDERVRPVGELSASGPAYQVIGVARNIRGVALNGTDSAQIYLPLPNDRLSGHPILIRTRSNPAQIAKTIRPLVASIDPNLMASSSTLEQMLRLSAPVMVSGFAAIVASALGLLGLLLVLLGIYGTISYIVVLRTREIGIRMAVGAQKRDILGLMLREITYPVIAGLLVGVLGAVGVSYLMHRLLYGFNPVDAISFAGVPLLFLAVALLAAYPPSRRATRVDPMVSLRYE